MTHQYFDVYECVAMPSVRFMEKLDKAWVRPTTEILLPRFVLLTPDRHKDFLASRVLKA